MSNNLNYYIISAVTFTLIGLMNTVFIRPEDIGSWKNYMGYFLLFIAFIDAVFIVIKILEKRKT